MPIPADKSKEKDEKAPSGKREFLVPEGAGFLTI